MKLGTASSATVVALVAAAGITFAWAIGGRVLAFAGRQTPPQPASQTRQPRSGGEPGPQTRQPRSGGEDQPQMAENVFKNIQVLKGIPVDDFMDTMGIMCAALSFDCSECHAGAGTDRVMWEADTPRKRIARRMVEMVTAINRDNFGGRQVVACWTCHRGRDIPVVMPAIDTVYGTPPLEADDIITRSSPGEPSPDEILDKYLQALGGAQRLASVTSFT